MNEVPRGEIADDATLQETSPQAAPATSGSEEVAIDARYQLGDVIG
jgi:hypothetical protein